MESHYLVGVYANESTAEKECAYMNKTEEDDSVYYYVREEPVVR